MHSILQTGQTKSFINSNFRNSGKNVYSASVSNWSDPAGQYQNDTDCFDPLDDTPGFFPEWSQSTITEKIDDKFVVKRIDILKNFCHKIDITNNNGLILPHDLRCKISFPTIGHLEQKSLLGFMSWSMRRWNIVRCPNSHSHKFTFTLMMRTKCFVM